MTDYFRLLSVPCSAQLRRKLDTTLHLVDRPTPERYAELTQNWEGHCPMQREDGLCALQAECGEGAISTTCRYYPRAIRTAEDDECCCSASCEAVVELLMLREAPLTFRRMDLTFDLALPPRVPNAKKREEAARLRETIIACLQDRPLSLPQRLKRLGELAARTEQREFPASLPVPEEKAREALAELIRELLLRHKSTEDLAEETLEALQKKEQMGNWPPEMERLMEHLLVNHVFYEDFPFSEHFEGPYAEYMSLCAVYAVLRAVLRAWGKKHPGAEAVADAVSACFRVMEHSAFDWNAAVLLSCLEMNTPEGMEALTAL